MKVNWVTHLDLVIPAFLQEVIKMIQLLLQDDEEETSVVL